MTIYEIAQPLAGVARGTPGRAIVAVPSFIKVTVANVGSPNENSRYLNMDTSLALPRLIQNQSEDHSSVLLKSLADAVNFVCMVAFAKKSGFNFIQSELAKRLNGGMTATFVVGVDFYQSEPQVLKDLLELQRTGNINVYMGNNERRTTFHPKLYLFESPEKITTIIGSANLTSGGLCSNHELSLAFQSTESLIPSQIGAWIRSLLEDGEIIEATDQSVNEYARRYEIYSLHMLLAQRQAKRAVDSPNGGRETLAQILLEMRADAGEEGFKASVKNRAVDFKEGQKMLQALAKTSTTSAKKFLSSYEDLIGRMHSGGLHRGKPLITKYRTQFRDAVRSLLRMESNDPTILFDHLLVKFSDVKGAGTNLISEILHLRNNKRFAVLNRNSVSGMERAGITGFPESPTKQNMDGAEYARFCEEASRLRIDLGLANFSELDALFNYAYWRDS